METQPQIKHLPTNYPTKPAPAGFTLFDLTFYAAYD